MAYGHVLPSWARMVNGIVTVLPFAEREMNARFYAEARLHMLREQRTADEAMAGRSFHNALDWIRYTERFKGENSPGKEMVQIREPQGQLRKVWYTQTMEYHMTGGEDLGRSATDSWGCYEVVRNSPCSPVYESDVQRAESMMSIIARVKLERERSTSFSSSTSNSHRLSPFSNQEFELEELAPPPAPSVSLNSLDVEASTDDSCSVVTARGGRTESLSSTVHLRPHPHEAVHSTGDAIDWRLVLGPSSTGPRMPQWVNDNSPMTRRAPASYVTGGRLA